MKKLRCLVICNLLLLVCPGLTAQVPAGLNYQAILRDNASEEIPDAPITVKFSVRSGSMAGPLVWEETHPATTNAFGFFNLVVGAGSKTGGSAAQFEDIPWGGNSYFLAVSVYYSSAWHDFPASQLLSVPYARAAEISLDNPFGMNADTVTLIDGSLSIGAPNPGRSKVAIVSQDDMSEDALFEVKRSDGQTIFAVYNEGVRIFLPTDPVTKGPKGGFAIGGFDRTKGDYTEDYLWVTPDSIRMYIDKTPDGKGPKGGFAIGGFDRTKAIIDDYMVLNGDSTRFYIDDTGLKGPKGGFAIGGFDRTKGYKQDYMKVTMDSTRFFVSDSTAGFAISSIGSGKAQSFMDVTTENYFIGHESGSKMVPSGSNGKYNSFLGYQTGKNTVNGRMNVALGYKAGLSNDASFNVFIGNETGRVNMGDYNLFLGHNSGFSNQYGNSNIFVGFNAGRDNVGGSSNTFIGYSCGTSNNDGMENTFLGKLTGYDNVSGNYNVIIGNGALRENEGGSNNVMIGYRAGYYNGFPTVNPNSSGNIFIGYRAGYNEYYSNKLYIENSSSDSPLIWGDFTDGSEEVRINGILSYTVGLTQVSDKRYKTDIEPIGNALDRISLVSGVYYNWNLDEFPDMVFGQGRQIGVIAQELEPQFPELVRTGEDGYKSVDYSKLTVVLLEAIKEQQKIIEQQRNDILELDAGYNRIADENSAILDQLKEIKAALTALEMK